MKRLPPQAAAWVQPLLLSILMTCVVSLVSTLLNTGAAPGLLARWLPAWGASWLIAFPTLMVMLPLVRRITAWVVRPPG